jgi:hypothetical protein
MSGSPLEILRRSLCWLVVIVELLLGFLILVFLGTTQVYARVSFDVALALILGLSPIVMACLATRNPKRASHVALWFALPFALLVMSRLPLYFPFPLIVGMAPTLLPGLFWLFASRRNWPLPISSELFPRRPLLTLAAVVSLWCVLLVASVAASLLLPWGLPRIGDCGGRPLLDENGKPQFVDFTAKILSVGPASMYGCSLFSIARVEERFSDSIWAVPKFVILRDCFHTTDRGETYFVEGSRSLGPFTRFLPLVERMECGRSGRTSKGGIIVALRILRDIPPRNGVRVIGFVSSDWLNPKPVSGFKLWVKGPVGTSAVVTDERGVYDVVGLPFGQYTVELPRNGAQPICALDLAKRAVGDCSFSLNELRPPAN